ncbi:uncharacterized protein LOC123506975 isoform X2 [Portunus trituberculatus]|uniref:uncharacterized protein LOC123506975 isoform X2 n=1 Tax=Portunus trituberculatus TaxID=210409 RepID=UPI001E1CCFE5|nr:uncharacterized protein LOC123506975 isoform X2 [Portunus trituberculatus]
MIKFLLQAVVLCAVAVVCIAYTRRGHKVGEASFDVDYRSVFEQPHLIKKVEKTTYLTVKKDVKEKVGRAKVRELKIPKGDMKKNKDEVEVNEDELKWNEQEFPSLDVTSIGASMASLRRFLHHARRVRKQATESVKRDVEVDALSLHRLSLHLQNTTSVPRASHPHQVVPFNYEDGGVPVAAAASSGRGVGGYDDCGGSQALGVFNFLTFMVYSLSLVMTVVTLAQGSMADTFLGQIINGVVINQRSFSAATPGLPDMVPKAHEVLGLVPRELLDTGRHPRDTASRQEEELKALRKELSVGMVTALLEAVRGPSRLWAKGSVRNCSSPARAWAHRYFTTHAHAILSSHT